MRLRNLSVLGISLAGGLVAGAAAGLLYAVMGGRMILHGLGTGWLLLGLLALALGLMGALEPPEGWASRRAAGAERRSFVARTAEEHPRIDRVTSWDLALWGIVVGGGLIAVSLVAFSFVRPS